MRDFRAEPVPRIAPAPSFTNSRLLEAAVLYPAADSPEPVLPLRQEPRWLELVSGELGAVVRFVN